MSTSHRIWLSKKESLRATAAEFDRRSPAARLVEIEDEGDEWRSVWLLLTATLVLRRDGAIQQDGPVMIGVRYHLSYLSEAPDPFRLVTLLLPNRVYHPNVEMGSGTLCLGHPQAGISLETILHQAWAGLTLNMRHVNTRWGDILNSDAAHFVRANADRFPLTTKGIFEPPGPLKPTPVSGPILQPPLR